MARLRILDGELAGEIFDVGDDPVTIGRLPRCHIHLPVKSVSREHARLFQRQGTYYVADLDSANGTFVNGKRVSRAEVVPGATLRLGKVSARFEATAGEPTADSSSVEVDVSRTAPSGTPAPTPGPRVGSAPVARDPHPVASPRPETRRGRRDTRPVPTRAPTARGGAPSRGSVFSHDVAQHGGVWRSLVYAVVMAIAAALFYGAYRLVRGG